MSFLINGKEYDLDSVGQLEKDVGQLTNERDDAKAAERAAQKGARINAIVNKSLTDKVAALEKERDELQRSECATRRELVAHREKAQGNYWAWQGDGEDHIESLVDKCPVLIHAGAFREILKDRDELRTELERVKEDRNRQGVIARAEAMKIAEGFRRERDELRAKLKSDQDEDWTPSLIDRLNEFARENKADFAEVRNGAEASSVIQAMHGRYNTLLATRRCLTDKVVALEKECEELKAKLETERELRSVADDDLLCLRVFLEGGKPAQYRLHIKAIADRFTTRAETAEARIQEMESTHTEIVANQLFLRAQAEAACEAKDNAIQFVQESFGAVTEQQSDALELVSRALSASCGKGWLSPEKAAELEASCAEMREAGTAFEVNAIHGHWCKANDCVCGLDKRLKNWAKALSTGCGKPLLEKVDAPQSDYSKRMSSAYYFTKAGHLEARVKRLEEALWKLKDGDFPGTPINKGSSAMRLIEQALETEAK